MKPHFPLILVAGLLLLSLALAVPVAAQAELTETFISGDETFAFNYPEGWQIKTDWLRKFVTLTDGDIELVFVGPAALGDSPDSEAGGDLNVTLAGFLDTLDIDHKAPTAAKLEGQREATVANITYQDEPGTALGLRFQNDEMGIVLVSGTDVTLADAMPTLTAIVMTFDSPVPAICTVRTDAERTVSARVGPGINRSAIVFLPANQDFEVLGKAAADDGSLWFKLDKQQVAPRSAAAELWVAQDDATTSGDCDAVVDAAAPPVIPIVVPSSSGAVTSTMSTRIIVPGNAGWVDSGVSLRASQTFTVSASGTVNIWPTCNQKCIGCALLCSAVTAGPAGSITPGEVVPSRDAYFVMPGAKMVALIGRIGEGNPFVIGGGGTFTSDGNGRLQLRVNEDVPYLGDETGAFTVTIEVRP